MDATRHSLTANLPSLAKFAKKEVKSASIETWPEPALGCETAPLTGAMHQNATHENTPADIDSQGFCGTDVNATEVTDPHAPYFRVVGFVGIASARDSMQDAFFNECSNDR